MVIQLNKLKKNMRYQMFFNMITSEFIHIPEICFKEDGLKYLIADKDNISKDCYIDLKNGEHHYVPKYCFEDGILENIIPIPDIYKYTGKILRNFLENSLRLQTRNRKLCREVKRMLSLDDGYMTHEFELYKNELLLRADYEKVLEKEKTKIAIQWCEENGFKYSFCEW